MGCTFRPARLRWARLGFERMLMFVTGVANIRDVIPFARTQGTAEF
jgi:aspartyl/asparaginyl-tRNA synthetase